jgi:16S rRNA processing protein RimM
VKWDDMALVGWIARAHGLRGQVVVNVETDFPEERFYPGAELFVRRGDGDDQIQPVTLTSVRFHAGRPVVGITGIDTIDAAEQWAGVELRVPVDRLAALPEGTFYRHDLIGCRVETAAGELVGVVRDVEGTHAGSRLVVAPAAPVGPVGTDGAEPRDDGAVLIPLASAICTAIDPADKRIVIDPPEGLLDLNVRSR